MTTRRPLTSSSSSSSSETEETTSRVQDISQTSRDTQQTSSRLQVRSPTNTFDGTSIADSVSIATTTNTGMTNTSLRQQMPGGIPIIRPPVLQQRPGGYPTQGPMGTTAGNQSAIRIDVTSAQQQYQQRAAQPDISPYSECALHSIVRVPHAMI